ncbi:acyltransferase [Vibrio ponticus]|uniref:Acyltransferase n=1 Tax=Vibrio ponticus TaxID=265668 RepID=A0A3N3DZ10_9VIBR|nr:acyltransferase [Vibrio ponticus]ROV59630.1 acyltransferase [Vibrio ponticus]
MNTKRLLELDALRGLAALAVVIFHYLYRYDEIYGHDTLNVEWSYLGKYGVHLFFMVSGFVIFWTLNRIERPLDFVISRFSRLYPAYWLAVILTFGVVYIFGLPGREVDIQTAVLNFLMFQEYLRISHVDGVYWTLTVELTFYFWVFVLYAFSQLRWVELIFTCLVLASVLNSLGYIEVHPAIYKLFLMKYIALFLSGICFFNIVNKSKSKLTLISLTIALLSSVFIFSLEVFLIIAIFHVVFYLSVTGRIKFMTHKSLVFLGGLSYSLYLLHQNIGYVIINLSYDMQFNPWVGIICATVISLLFATMSMKFVEKPALSYIRRRYNSSDKIQKLASKMTVLRGNS